MLDDTPIPSRISVITDYTEDMAIGGRLEILMGHVLPDVRPMLFDRADKARRHLGMNKAKPPFIYNIMWPRLHHFDTPEALEEEIRRVGWLIWGLEFLVNRGLAYVIIYGIPGREEIKNSLMKMQRPQEETKRFNLQVEKELEHHRPLGEPRQPPIADYIEMGTTGDGVNRLCVLWTNMYEAFIRTRVRS